MQFSLGSVGHFLDIKKVISVVHFLEQSCSKYKNSTLLYAYMRKEYLLLGLLALALLLPNLGDRIITGDEAYTVMIGNTILEHGIPSGTYGDFLINPKDTAWTTIGGFPTYTWVSWMQHYISAGMSTFFGLSEFWQRFPFVLFGIASILLTFYLTERLTQKKNLAWVASLLMLTAVSFLLHARQARWYTPSLFFTTLAILGYWIWLKDKRMVWMVLGTIFLFHSNQLFFFEIMFALAGYHLLFQRKSIPWKNIGTCLGIIFLCTFPWFILTDQLAKGSGLGFSLVRMTLNIALNMYYIFILLTPLLFVILYAWVYKKKEYQTFILTISALSILFLSVKTDHLPAIRYLINLLPLFFLINAEVLVWMYHKKKEIAIALGCLLILTNILHIIPFAFAKDQFLHMPVPIPEYEKQHFIESSLNIQAPLVNYIYEITHTYVSAEKEIIRYIQTHGKKGETFITSDFPHTFILYLADFHIGKSQMRVKKYYEAFDKPVPQEKPNWIIPRKFKVRTERTEEFLSNADQSFDLETYTIHQIRMREDRWANSPDPLNHRYWTERDGEVLLYYSS